VTSGEQNSKVLHTSRYKKDVLFANEAHSHISHVNIGIQLLSV